MILKYMAIGNYKRFMFFHTKQHAKHGGGGFEGRKGKGHMEFKDHLHHKMLIIFSMPRTMLKHGGGHTTLHFEHRKGR
jgi:hypothetical protein